MKMDSSFHIDWCIFKQLDKQRRERKTEDIPSEADALCGGCKGDEQMQINIDLCRLANKLESSIWE